MLLLLSSGWHESPPEGLLKPSSWVSPPTPPSSPNSLGLGWDPGLGVSQYSQTRLMLPAPDHAWNSYFSGLCCFLVFLFVCLFLLVFLCVWRNILWALIVRTEKMNICKVHSQWNYRNLAKRIWCYYQFILQVIIFTSTNQDLLESFYIWKFVLCTMLLSSHEIILLDLNLSTQCPVILDPWGRTYLSARSWCHSLTKHSSLSG